MKDGTATKRLSVDLDGQVAVVTGASQGLGKAIAAELARQGCKVACIARNVEKLAGTVAEIAGDGGVAEAIPCDVKDRQSVDQVMDGIQEKWGRLDILVNNAG